MVCVGYLNPLNLNFEITCGAHDIIVFFLHLNLNLTCGALPAAWSSASPGSGFNLHCHNFHQVHHFFLSENFIFFKFIILPVLDHGLLVQPRKHGEAFLRIYRDDDEDDQDDEDGKDDEDGEDDDYANNSNDGDDDDDDVDDNDDDDDDDNGDDDNDDDDDTGLCSCGL